MPGYELCAEDRERFDSNFLCTRCEHALRDPIQTLCGHRYCKTCIDPIIAQGGPQSTCLVDNQILKQMFEDKFARREILSISVGCRYRSSGCSWSGELRELENHLELCPWVTVKCDQKGCSDRVRRKDLEEHHKNLCIYRLVICTHCNGSVTFKDVEVHEKICPAFPVKCEHCGKTGITRQKLSEHVNPQSGDCEAIEAMCPFGAVGCQHNKKMKKKEQHSHIAKNSASHLTLLLAFVQQVSGLATSAMQDAQADRNNASLVSSLEETVSANLGKVERIVKENVDLRDKLARNRERIVKLETPDNRRMLYGDDVEPDSALFHSTNQRQSSNCETIRQLNNQEAKVSTHEILLVEANRSLEEQQMKTAFLERQLELSKESIRRLERRVESQDHMMTLRNMAMADLEEYIRQQDVSSYDGILLWKITDFARRRNDALTGKQTSFYSPCFYTSRHGYKMCARIYLNGDGMGKGSHISLFFVVMRGNYDSLMSWPFSQKVTMMILDQDNVEHVIDAFNPDPNSSSFKKPAREMNIASGAPRFCPLTELDKHAYVQDDTMFVKIMVDTSNL